MTERPPPPTVTLHGAPVSAGHADLLEAGRDDAADPRPLRRRRVVGGLLGLGLLVVVGAGGQYLDRREALAQEQRDRSTVQLRLSDDWSGTSAYEAASDSIRYQVQLTVTNDGPRDVEVLGIGLPGVELAAPVALADGQERFLTLDGVYSCRDSFPQGGPPTAVPFEVRTQAGPRSVEVPIPAGLFDTDPLVEACDQIRASRSGPAGDSADPSVTS